jgi:hypothetical protein
MAEEVRLWKIENRTELRALNRSKLDLEERLEGFPDRASVDKFLNLFVPRNKLRE